MIGGGRRAASVHAHAREKRLRSNRPRIKGKLHFVLPSAIGAAHVVDDVTPKELAVALKKLGMRG